MARASEIRLTTGKLDKGWINTSFHPASCIAYTKMMGFEGIALDYRSLERR